MTAPIVNAEPKFRFVTIGRQGRTQDGDDSWAIRSHIRRSVLSSYKFRDLQENFRFFTPPQGLQTVSKTLSAEERSAKRTANQRIKIRVNEQSSTPQAKLGNGPRLRRQIDAHKRIASHNEQYFNFKLKNLSQWHPFTAYISEHVHLSSSRIDGLLKSVAFRISAEPIFDAGHVDSNRSLTQVFPGCLAIPAFLNALMYSIIQAENKDHAPEHALALKGQSIQYINQMIMSGPDITHSGLIGTIMILKGTAYRANESAAHEAHSNGLAEVLRLYRSKNVMLPVFVARVAYWLDLNGAALMNSPRRLLDLLVPEINWNRYNRPGKYRHLPPGIATHWDVIPDSLLECFEDILELDASVAEDLEACQLIDDMQASIESRLALQAKLCKDFGVAAECSRLAAYICCYTSFSEIWKNFLIPCRCASMLLGGLVSSFDDPIWVERRNLQLWLVLVGSCTALLDNGHLEGLRSSYDSLLLRMINTVSTWPDARISLQSALNDFIYSKTWLRLGQGNREWLRLAALIRPCSAVPAPFEPLA